MTLNGMLARKVPECSVLVQRAEQQGERANVEWT